MIINKLGKNTIKVKFKNIFLLKKMEILKQS